MLIAFHNIRRSKGNIYIPKISPSSTLQWLRDSPLLPSCIVPHVLIWPFGLATRLEIEHKRSIATIPCCLHLMQLVYFDSVWNLTRYTFVSLKRVIVILSDIRINVRSINSMVIEFLCYDCLARYRWVHLFKN